MKLTILLLTTALATAHAAADAQSISLSGKDLTLKQIFQTIEKQTGYVFFYNRGDLEGTHQLSLEARDMPLKDFLNLIFKDQPLTYKLTNRTIMLSRKPETRPVGAPPVIINGTVLGPNSQPLAGATVRVKDKRISTSTDKDGKFRIPAEIGQTLVFSFVGYGTEERKIEKAEEMSVVLQTRSNDLKEVAVTTAYGLEKNKRELGYSTAKVSGEEINRTAPGNLLTGLTGKVSGLNISGLGADMNDHSSVLLRGLRSINTSANNQPLFILNGAPLSFGSDQLAAAAVIDMLNSLNPNDIQDVTVLKGANATALYGPEGVNGVILINTKKGTGKSFGINFQSSTSWQKIIFKRKVVQKTYGPGSTLDANGNAVYDPFVSSTDLWGPAYNGKSVPLGRPDENGDRQMVPYSYNDSRFKFWNMARLTQNSLSLTQQDEKSDFYLGLNYNDQTGVLPGDKQSRENLILNTGRTINRITKLRLNILYDRASANTGPSQLRTDNDPAFVQLTSYKDYVNNKWADHNHWFEDNGTNPYEDVALDRTNTLNNVLSSSFELRLTPLRWLTIVERPALNYYGSVAIETIEPTIFSDFAKSSGRPAAAVDLPASMVTNNLAQISLNNDLLISTTHHMGFFGLKTTIGNSIRETNWKQTQVIVPRLAIPVFNPIYAEDNNRAVLERDLLSRINSVFGTFQFDYKQKIYLELVGRQDWDSKVVSEARSHNYYGGGNLSVILSDIIPGLQEKKWMNMWKVRAALNTTANMNILPQDYARTLYSQYTYGDLPFFIYDVGNPNPNIRPEKILSQEYGTELTLFNNRLQFDASYYRQRNNGLILNVATSQYSAAPTIDNAGVYRNQGMDLTLKFNDLLKGRNGFFLDLSLLYAYNDNRVLSLPPSMGGQLLTYANNTRLVAQTGGHAYAYGLTDFMRTPDGKVIVDPASGIPMIDYDKAVYKGRALPLNTAGININMGWNGFTFGGTAEYRGGNDQFNEQGAIDMRAGLLPQTTYNNRQPFVVPNSVYMDGSGKYVNNTSLKVSSARDYFIQASYADVQFLSHADFFRLDELYLGYDLPLKSGKIIKKIGIKLYGRNLLNIYTRDNINGDPLSVRGPGWNRNDLQVSDALKSDNSAGAVGSTTRLPGISSFGFSVNASF